MLEFIARVVDHIPEPPAHGPPHELEPLDQIVRDPANQEPPLAPGSSVLRCTESSSIENAELSALRFGVLALAPIKPAAQLGGPPVTSKRGLEV